MAILIAVSLFSQGEETNLIGAAGSFVAWALTFTVGLAGYEVPFLVAILAIKLLLRRIYEFNFAVIAGIMLFIIASSGILALLGYLEIEPNVSNVLGGHRSDPIRLYRMGRRLYRTRRRSPHLDDSHNRHKLCPDRRLRPLYNAGLCDINRHFAHRYGKEEEKRKEKEREGKAKSAR